MNTLYERIYEEHQRLQYQIESLQTQLHDYPDGKLICCQNGNHCKWYQSDGHTKTYIPKSDRNLAEQLAAKKYLSSLQEDLSHEKNALELYLKHHYPMYEKAKRLLTESSGFQELLSPFFKPRSQELSDWMNAPYERNLNHPEHLTHKTTSGHYVRSKSESLITLLLYTSRIPFRYECALHLGEATFYPDFTIRHPYTGALYYWEHFGRMDDPNYIKNVYSKLQIYTLHNIIPTIQLITTYETKNNPLTAEVIEKTIAHYFL